MASPVLSCDELMASLKRGEVPAGGFDKLKFTVSVSGSGAQAPRIEARMVQANDPADDPLVPAAVLRNFKKHLLHFTLIATLESIVGIARLTARVLSFGVLPSLSGLAYWAANRCAASRATAKAAL